MSSFNYFPTHLHMQMILTGEVGTDPSSSGAHPQRRTFSQREPRIARVDGVRVVVND